MKASAVTMSALLLLSLGGLGWTHHRVSATASNMAYQEHRLAGELSAADGLSVELHAQLDSRLFWDAQLIPGQSGTADFHFSPKQIVPENTPTGYFELYSPISFQSSTSGSFALDKAPQPWLADEILKPLAERTRPGTTQETTVRLSDYEDYFPLSMDIQTHAYHYISDFDRPSAFTQKLLDAFRFPVPEGHLQTFSIEKDAAGNLVGIHCSPAAGSEVQIFSTCWASEDTLYFTITAETGDDQHLMDYSHTLHGYGIYALPMDKADLTMDDLEFIAPLDADSRPITSDYDAFGNHLLYVSKQGDTSTIHCLDLTTRRETQQISAAGPISSIYANEDILLVFYDEGRARFYQQSPDGSYVYQFNLNFPADGAFHFLTRPGFSFSYDGDRLAIAVPILGGPEDGDIPYANTLNTSYSLYVFGREGTRYAADFASCLDVGYTGYSSPATRCRLSDLDGAPLVLHTAKEGTVP